MPIKTLRAFLDANGVRYVTISHSPAFTAQEIAASAHVPGQEMAKTVVVFVDGRPAMAVLPATCKVDFDLLKEVTGAHDVRLASENEFKDLFPGCELGAMPPFGNLFGLEVYLAPSLTRNRWIAFNAGSHTEVMKMVYGDFARLVEPTVVAMAY